MWKIERKIWDFLDNYGICIVLFIIALVIVGWIDYAITAPNLTEGLVMNKRYSPGYFRCYDGNCHSQGDRWIIEVQNGDEKDWWTVTENYYDAVKIGDWVTK